jgi:hypothetical protein
VVALSLGGLMRKVEAAMLPEDVIVTLGDVDLPVNGRADENAVHYRFPSARWDKVFSC